ncbi:hypothetical protein [Oceanobacillus sp. FSL W7-1293]|uniref:hypothetical protein n=1 Tax=Oceanobacillus sp. FSL W7-1293 TaxID=2921699 RepID=UPI0030D4084A
MYSTPRICMMCNCSTSTIGSKNNSPEVIECPECGGPFVDKFHYAKYKQQHKPDVFDPLDSLAYILEQANKAVEEAKEAKENNPVPLLTIELEDMNSVPVVKYKGEELVHKTHVKFDWEQKTDKSFGGVEFDIEHHVSEAKQNKIGHFNTIKKASTFKGSSM